TTTITGTAIDSDGFISTLQVFANGSSIGTATVTSGAWTINWTPTSTGVVLISAIATDDKANATISPPIVVNVTDATSPTVALSVTPGTNGATSTTLPVGATRNIL